MSWGKVDDALHDHPKVDAALEADELRGAAAMGLWVLALSYASDQLTDGHVSRRAVGRMMPEHGRDLAAELVARDLWETTSEGWLIRGYLDCNPSRADVLSKRAADAQRKADQRAKSERTSARKSARTTADVQPDGATDSAAASEPPVPTRPDPTRPTPNADGSATVAGRPHLDH